jgi:hypothetical protein
VLIAISPFGVIDSLLKLFKIALLSSIVVSYAISPYLAAAVSIIILILAASLAPWAFRLTFFGAVFAWDILAPGRSRRHADLSQPTAFLAKKADGAAPRTYGRLILNEEGGVAFAYRPWLILKQRFIPLNKHTLAICKGAFFPSLIGRVGQKNAFRTLIIFPPRYRRNEETVARHLGVHDIREGGIIRSFKAVRAWFTDTLALGRRKRADISP